MGTGAGRRESDGYSANIRPETIKWFFFLFFFFFFLLTNCDRAIVHQLEHPPPGFEEVIRLHFGLKKRDILLQAKKWLPSTTKNKELVAKLSRLLGKL